MTTFIFRRGTKEKIEGRTGRADVLELLAALLLPLGWIQIKPEDP